MGREFDFPVGGLEVLFLALLFSNGGSFGSADGDDDDATQSMDNYIFVDVTLLQFFLLFFLLSHYCFVVALYR